MKDKRETILVVDDEASYKTAFEYLLEDKYSVLYAPTGKEAVNKIKRQNVDLVVLDIGLPDISGIDVLKQIKEYSSDIEVIMLTARSSVEAIVESIKSGANEYIVKPFVEEEILLKVKNILEKKVLKRELEYFKKKSFKDFVGEDKKIKDIFRLVDIIVDKQCNVLILGESGTGKELIAKAIHKRSKRNKKPFRIISCASLPETLVESELFGYNKGTFTGAVKNQKGKIETAAGGTVLFDDIDNLSLEIQAKLLRVVETKEITRIGASKPIKVNVRFLASSNKNLERLVSEGNFREDLFYRLNVVSIEIPPLRERKEDIPILVASFLKAYEKEDGEKKIFTQKAVEKLMEPDWYGNVRELKNFVKKICIIEKSDTIDHNNIIF